MASSQLRKTKVRFQRSEEDNDNASQNTVMVMIDDERGARARMIPVECSNGCVYGIRYHTLIVRTPRRAGVSIGHRRNIGCHNYFGARLCAVVPLFARLLLPEVAFLVGQQCQPFGELNAVVLLETYVSSFGEYFLIHIVKKKAIKEVVVSFFGG